MQAGPNSSSVINPAQYIAMARRWWWVLLLVPLFAAGSAYLFSMRQVPTYSATATLFVSQASPSSADVTAAKLLTKTYSQLVISRPVLEQVIADLKLTRTPPELAAQISTGTVVDTQIIKITAVDSDPNLAAFIVNTTGAAFVDWIAAQQTLTSQQSAGVLQEDLDRAQTNIEQVSSDLATLRGAQNTSAADERRIVALDAELRQLQTTYTTLTELQQRLEFTPQSRVILTAPAEPPSSPDSPQPLRNAGLAFLASLAMLLVGIVLFESLIDRVRLPDDVQRKVDLSVLGSIPRARRMVGIEIISAPYSAMSEAIRSLRAAVQFATNGHRVGALVIASPGPHEGKSLIAANLAAAFAEAGQRVVLVDGDLRRPRQHELFGGSNRPGLADALSSPAAQDDPALGGSVAVGRRRIAGRRYKPLLDQMLASSPVPGLKLLPAGTTSRNPSELLNPEHLKQLIADLKQSADVIVIDASPLLTVSDALLLAAAADHALVVAEAGRTRTEALNTAITMLNRTGVDILGIVLNSVTGTPQFAGYLPSGAVGDPAGQNHNGHTVSTPIE